MTKNIRFAFLMAVTLFAVSAKAEPMAYSVNADSQDGDYLYLIDLATGVDELQGKLNTGIEDRTDTEGLAFSPEVSNALWGIDDASGTLFPLSLNGSINWENEIQLPFEFQIGGGNDFGMTFTCDSNLFFTTVKTQTLHRRDPEGNFTTIGAEGSLGVKISAIAAIGNPTKLYGLGNGMDVNGNTDAPNLYRIDPVTGTASVIGALGSPGQFQYNEAGMAFDADGGLWVITDRSLLNNQKSQILKVNVITGAATLISTTVNEVGYESLAIGPPANCEANENSNGGFLPIPTLSLVGRLSAILVLMLAGMLILRRRLT